MCIVDERGTGSRFQKLGDRVRKIQTERLINTNTNTTVISIAPPTV